MNYPGWIMAAAAILGIVNTLGVAWIIWSIRSMIAQKVGAALEGVSKDMRELEKGLLVLETRSEALPTTEDLHALATALKDVAGELKAIGERFAGLKETMARVERTVERHENIIARAAQGS
ncbi:DUF2730 family protein [Niveispirillum cyanobacteriorum]|uniref:Uncharacterized protein n=1 Tax=Niveispirillum cyanobacteriorum TaxID=1612173 RepID=A0A2K9NDN0_9PROT|nr:DUF2730 family protein [Niveispirillum cyanobacteriorum]AUN31251.1 hypothetical protein C0V82_14165 [Niveispirillum cyanobacteriorum]GGE72930.1 hypothetical protein GCM10011317_32700 [Niveispirillum cyanobacteriorum]